MTERRCSRSPRLLTAELFSYRSFVRCVQALVFLRMTPQLSVWDQNICRHALCLSPGGCIKLVMQSCCTSSWLPSGFYLAFAKTFGFCWNLKRTEATASDWGPWSFIHLLPAMWKKIGGQRELVVAQDWGSRPHAGLYKIPVVISNPISETSGGWPEKGGP